MRFQIPLQVTPESICADGPYSVHKVGSGSNGKRKYPEGDWMTSPQWFEDVKGGFTSQSFVDISTNDASGILITHSGSQQWFLTETGIESIILAKDPWDEKNYLDCATTSFRLFPHHGLTNSDCSKRAKMTYGQSPSGESGPFWPLTIESGAGQTAEYPPMPLNFSAVTVHSPDVLATAFYREQESFCKRGLASYAGEGMGHPYVLRLVEYDGVDGEVEVTLAGPIAKAYKTNMIGEVIQELSVHADENSYLTTETEKLEPFGIQAVRISVPMRAHEIATIYLDIVPGRKQFRDLDAKREIWATVHRVED